METLKAIGMGILAAVLTGITLVSGFVFSVIATVFSIAVAILGVIFGAVYLVWQAHEDTKDGNNKGPD